MNADVLLVVAAGPGLGRAVARRFAREGAAVGLLARRADPLDEIVVELAAAGARQVATAAGDVAQEAALRRGLGQLRAALGPATVLVYNGSAYVAGPVTSLTPDALRLALDVGVVGAVVAVQEVLPAMRAAGRGTVILTGSVAADRASTGAAAVGVAKAGLRSLARSLHKEVAGPDLRVTTVTIDGVLSGPQALDVDQVADLYWRLHTGEVEAAPEVRFPS